MAISFFGCFQGYKLCLCDSNFGSCFFQCRAWPIAPVRRRWRLRLVAPSEEPRLRSVFLRGSALTAAGAALRSRHTAPLPTIGPNRSLAPARPLAQPSAALTLLYDGGCPLCLREVRFLEGRDRRRHGTRPRLAFVDIDAPGYNAATYAGITYGEAMGRIHALAADGTVLRDVAVFRRAYQLIGLGWLYAPTSWPLLGPLANSLYRLWAAGRLRLTGRPSLEQLCAEREGRCRI